MALTDLSDLLSTTISSKPVTGSGDDFHSGCQNVNRCHFFFHHKQSFSGLQLYTLLEYHMTPAFKTIDKVS